MFFCPQAGLFCGFFHYRCQSRLNNRFLFDKNVWLKSLHKFLRHYWRYSHTTCVLGNGLTVECFWCLFNRFNFIWDHQLLSLIMNPSFFLRFLRGSPDIFVLIINASTEGVLAKSEDQITSLGVGFKMFEHCLLSFNSLPSQDALLKIVTVEECEVLEVN